jgi:thiol-disulfide isomerase/thioredoxin
MKKLIPIAIAIVLISCGKGPGEYGIISGTIEGGSGKTLILQRYEKNRVIGIDSATIDAQGNFSLKPSFGMTMDYYSLKLADTNEEIRLITDSTEDVTIKGVVNNLTNGLEIKGSPNSQLLQEYYGGSKKFKEQIDSIKSVITAGANDPAIVANIKSDVTRINRDRRDFCKNFIAENPQSPAAMIALLELDITVDMDEYQKVQTALKDNFSSSNLYKQVGERIRLARLASEQKAKQAQQDGSGKNFKYGAGANAPDIVMSDPSGKTRKLSDLRGKVVLIDFWASWCGPCRRENPTVVRLYDKYKKDGFEVFSVSLDKSQEPWIKAIEQDQLKWENHVCDMKGWENAAAREYGVSSIPHTLLINKEGVILGTGLRGNLLEDKLKEIFGR